MLEHSHDENGLRIFAIDIGTGTQDVLIYNSGKNLENCIKLVLPSPTKILAEKVRRASKHIFVHGVTMGGGPFAFALRQHIQKGYRVAMQEEAAYTVRDDLSQVREMGIEIAEEPPFEDYIAIETKDVDMELFIQLLNRIGESTHFDFIGVAVQDHGRAPEGMSDRIFRFSKLAELMKKSRSYLELGYTNPPEYFTRMQGVLKTLREYRENLFISDSKLAAIVGALHGVSERPAMAVDVGNGHTLIAIVDEGNRVIAMLEHHTSSLNEKKLEDYMVRLADGKITNQEVYEDGGHGCVVLEACGFDRIRRIMVTGPRRNLLRYSRLSVEFASPGGDVMMTGTIGLVDMIEHTLAKSP